MIESPHPKEAVDDSTVTNTSTTTTSTSTSSSSTSQAELSGGGLPSANGLTVSGGGFPSTNGLTVNEDTAKKPSSEHAERLSEGPSVELDTSFEQDNVFTITLRKGFRGLGFMLDKQRSLAEGMFWESHFTYNVFNCVFQFIGGIFIGSIESDPAKSDGRLQPGDQILEV
jgi:hypothetical protein